MNSGIAGSIVFLVALVVLGAFIQPKTRGIGIAGSSAVCTRRAGAGTPVQHTCSIPSCITLCRSLWASWEDRGQAHNRVLYKIVQSSHKQAANGSAVARRAWCCVERPGTRPSRLAFSRLVSK